MRFQFIKFSCIKHKKTLVSKLWAQCDSNPVGGALKPSSLRVSTSSARKTRGKTSARMRGQAAAVGTGQ